jgi:uncharacterized membrane protein
VILPGTAERLLAIAEKEQSHRHGQDKSTSQSFTEYQFRGQRFALVTSAIFVVGAVVASIAGEQAVAITLGAAGPLTLSIRILSKALGWKI